MALPLSKVDTDTIRLVGWWWNNKTLCYLHTTAMSFTLGFTVRMLQHGDYVLIPTTRTGF